MEKRIGDLRERVAIERRGRLAAGGGVTWDGSDAVWDASEATWSGAGDGDGYGNYQTAWGVMIHDRAAAILPRRGGEQVVAARLTGVDAYDIVVRSDRETEAVRPGDRVVDRRDRSRIWNIRFVGNLDARRRYILLQCSLGDAEG